MQSRIRPLLSSLLASAAVLGLATAAAAANEVSERIEFSTEDQGLFGPDATPVRHVFPIESLFSTDESLTQGEIVHVNAEIPQETAERIWQQAMDTCTAYRYTRSFHSACGPVTIRPTAQECETGFIGTRTQTVTCCYFGDAWSNGCTGGWTRQETRTKTLNIDVGARIGPRPTGPIPKDVDLGAIVSYEARVDVGLELEIEADPGSVEVRYPTVASLETDRGRVEPGEVFTVTARHQPDEAGMQMASQYPNLDFKLRYFVDADAHLDMDWAGIDSDGHPVREQTNVFDFSTADLPDSDEQGRMVGEIVGVAVGLSGLEVRFLNGVPYAPENARDRVFGFPLSFTWDITNPFQCPSVPILTGLLCAPTPPISYDIFELMVRTPQMNTPAPAASWTPLGNVPFNVGLDPGGVPLQPKRNQVSPRGTLVNTTPNGLRPVAAGLVSDLDPASVADFITNGFSNEGRLETDFVRVDMDVDGLFALAGAPPLGINFEFGEVLGYDAEGKPIRPMSGELNAIDLDLANWIHLDQTLEFEPQLVAVLRFDKPVYARLVGAEDYTFGKVFEMPVEASDSTRVEIVQPQGGVRITPTYSLRHNRFTNTTDFLYTLGAQETFAQLKLEGLIAETVGNAIGLDPNVTLYQASQFVLGVDATTYTSSPGAPGAQRLQVEDATKFEVAEIVGLHLDDGSEHKTTLTGVGDGFVDFADPLPSSMAWPKRVRVLNRTAKVGTQGGVPYGLEGFEDVTGSPLVVTAPTPGLACGLGSEMALLLPVLLWLRARPPRSEA